jgi:antitoxin HicB
MSWQWPNADRVSGGKVNKMTNKFSGSDFDDFLAEEGILEEVSSRALKRLLAMQLAEIMAESQISKSQLAELLSTSRSQVDRLLDPENTTVTLESLDKLARAVGRQLRVEFA